MCAEPSDINTSFYTEDMQKKYITGLVEKLERCKRLIFGSDFRSKIKRKLLIALVFYLNYIALRPNRNR